jgi:hypothetical protein
MLGDDFIHIRPTTPSNFGEQSQMPMVQPVTSERFLSMTHDFCASTDIRGKGISIT